MKRHIRDRKYQTFLLNISPSYLEEGFEDLEDYV